MSGLTFKLKSAVRERINASGLTPKALSGLAAHEIAAIPVGVSKLALTAGDVFDISGSPGDSITIAAGAAAIDFAGEGLDGGTVIVDGPAGAYAGRRMSGGRLEIKGDAGNYLASGQSGGLIHVAGSAGDNLGGVLPGDRFGMLGGIVVVDGDIGARAGDKMRRGTVVIKGKTGPGAGTRMIGGTIWAEGGFGEAPGYMMRRGTLIGPSVARLLPTFADCGRHDLLIVRILNRYLKGALGDTAPKPMPLFVQKIAGDMATIGKGEILLPAN